MTMKSITTHQKQIRKMLKLYREENVDSGENTHHCASEERSLISRVFMELTLIKKGV